MLLKCNPVEVDIGGVVAIVASKFCSAHLEVCLVDVINKGHYRVVSLGPILVVIILVIGGYKHCRGCRIGGGELNILAVEVDLLPIHTSLGVQIPFTSSYTPCTSIVVLVSEPKLRVAVGESHEVVVE